MSDHVPNEILFSFLQKVIPYLLIISNLLGKFPVIGTYIKKIIPVANYNQILPLNKQQQIEWSLLDTYDWFSPIYDYPQTPKNVRAWMENSRLIDIEVLKAGHLVARGKKK